MWWLLPLLVAAVIVQALAFPGMIGTSVRPDLPLVIVLGWASVRGWEQAVVAALVGGFVADLLSAAPFGVNTLRLAALAWAVGVGADRLQRTSPLLPIIAAGGGSVLGVGLDLLGLQAAGWSVRWDGQLLVSVLATALLTAVCMAAAAPALRSLARLGEREEPRLP